VNQRGGGLDDNHIQVDGDGNVSDPDSRKRADAIDVIKNGLTARRRSARGGCARTLVVDQRRPVTQD
jgi:hypothetical protein